MLSSLVVRSRERGDARTLRLCWPSAPLSPCLPYSPLRPCCAWLPRAPSARHPPWLLSASGQRPPFSFAPRSSVPHCGLGISLAPTLFFCLPRPCVWPLPSSFPLPAYLDCFRVSVVKSSAYRRRKQLTYKLHPTTRNRLAVIAAGGRSLQPFDVAQVNPSKQGWQCASEYPRRTTESGNQIEEDA